MPHPPRQKEPKTLLKNKSSFVGCGCTMGVLATNVFNVKEKQAATGEGAEILVQNERDFEFA